MRLFSLPIWLIASQLLAFQGICFGIENSSETKSLIVQPERVSLLKFDDTLTGSYLCIEPCNLLTQFLPKKTIFQDEAPNAIGSFDESWTTVATFLQQTIKTTPLGDANLSKKAIGEDLRKTPGWLNKALLITLGCSILGFILSAILPRRNTRVISALQLIFILVPLGPFLLLLLMFGFMSITLSSVRDPMVDIYVDNATPRAYEIMLNGDNVHLPSMSHVCLRIRPRDHDLRISDKSSSQETRYAVTSGFDESETYIINVEGANSYPVEHKFYSKR